MSLKKFFTYVLMIVASTILTLGTLFFLFIAMITALAGSVKDNLQEKEGLKMSAHNVLVLQMDYPIKNKPGSPFDNFDPATFKFNPPLTLPQLIEVIDEASGDEKIDGILLRPGMIQAGFATVEELREALNRFRGEGKFVYAYSDFYTQKSYYLSTIADKIFLHPAGIFEWRGLAAQILFYKDLLDKLGIKMQVIRHGKFKSAVEPFVNKRMSSENRIQTRTLLFDVWESVKVAVGSIRSISIKKLKFYADSLVVDSPETAKSLGFFDGLKYSDEVEQYIKAKIEADEVGFITEREYFKKLKTQDLLKQLAPKEEIAVLVAEGEIVPGKGDDKQIGSARLIDRIRKLRDRDRVKAVVLRINSPGGSALASESIWRELKLLAAEKPLIVSMGDVAASGGYYIATPAEKIFAEENTITGSIGVFGLIPDVQELMENKLGITVDTVKTNTHADMGVFRPMDNRERQYMQKMVEETYSLFVKRVAEGRDMTMAEVDSIGQGRVWSGKRAVKLGLVDDILSLEQTLNYVRSTYQLENAKVKFYPAALNPFENLFDMEAGEVRLFNRFFSLLFPGLNMPKPAAGISLEPRQRIRMQMPYEIRFAD